MAFQDLPIKRKVMAVIMLTSIVVLFLTGVAFMVYDLVTYHQMLVRNLVTSADITANASTAALAFQDETFADQSLNALKADPNIISAAFYDLQGNLFARTPATAPVTSFPLKPGKVGPFVADGTLQMFEIVQENGKQLGTLYVRSSLKAQGERLRTYAGIALLVLLGSVFIAFLISTNLQERITNPILALAESAKMVSERGDYSVRARKVSGDEIGMLTDSYNLMLARIQEQTFALRQREDQLRLTIEASKGGTWDWNLLTNHMEWDDYLYSFFGLERGQFQETYDHFLTLIHPEDRETVRTTFARALEQKTEIAVEFRAIWPDATVHTISARGKVVSDEAGKAIRCIGMMLDVTERKRAEESRSFLAAIVNSSDDAVIGKDLESKVVSWNAGAERMFGYTSDEILGKPVNILLSPDRPDEEKQILREVVGGDIRHFETVRVRKDGLAIDVALTVSPIKNAAGKIIGISSIARDITDRRRSEAALQRHAAVLREQAQMLDLANVLARDLEDHIILWNTGMEKMYGWQKSEALGKVSHELFRTEFPESIESARVKLFHEGRWEGELVHFRKDGRRIFVASQWVLHSDAQGRPAAILEINNDITERRRAEEEVVRVNQELERRVEDRTSELIAANREMEAFTYSVAHDLRAPLRHIDAFARILHEDFAPSLPPEAQRFLENIRNGSRNMSRLVDDLLNLARVGRQELKRQLVPLGGLVNEVVAELRNETGGRKIDWRIQPLPPVQCDAGLMKQVLTNLLSNAVKYTRPREEAVIEIGSNRKNGEITFFVRDNGVGFNMKYSDKLFGVFQRLHRAEEFEGTGVGLATVDRIVRKHGGTVWAEAEVDKGATFYFTMPVFEKSH